MKISIMIEDSKLSDDFENEFGLSLHIKANSANILMDTATTGAFTKNAAPLGIDIKDVDMAVISHSHFDHGGGLEAFLKSNKKAKIYLKEGAKGSYYANVTAKLPSFLTFFLYPLIGRSKRLSRYIGLNKSLFDEYPDRFVFADKLTELNEGIFILTDIPKKYPISKGNMFLLEEKDGILQRDEFEHELVLAVKEDDGLVIFTGCGHSGVLNMLDAVISAFPDSPVKAIVGGFHLKLKPMKDSASGTKDEIEAIAKKLMEQNVRKVYTGHCTGKEAYDFMKNVMGENLGRIQTGTVIEI
jgi:7,8-dihydropterin-6-yl-methyl-4-(beta-D-ribofuranosyl)aminobenzene 5'-phosphate synthase